MNKIFIIKFLCKDQLATMADLESEADEWIYQNTDENMTLSPCSIIFYLTEWSSEYSSFNSQNVFGKEATISLFKNPNKVFKWNSFPVYSLLLNAKSFFVYPTKEHDTTLHLIQKCNGCVTSSANDADFGIIPGPVISIHEWMDLRKSKIKSKGKAWIVKLEGHLTEGAFFEKWETWGNAKVLEGFACFITSCLTSCDLIRTAVQNGATVYQYVQKTVTIIFPLGYVPSLEQLKFAEKLKCDIVQEEWLRKVLELGYPPEMKIYSLKTKFIENQQCFVETHGVKVHFLVQKEYLEPEILQDLYSLGYEITDQMHSADIVVSDVVIPVEWNASRLITKFCLVSKLNWLTE